MRVAKKDWLVINYILLNRYVFLWLRQKLCLLYLLPRSPPWKLRVAHRNEILGRRCRRLPMQPERANIFPLLWSPPPSCHLPLPDSMSHHRHRCQVRTFLSTSRRTNRTVDIIPLSCLVGPPPPSSRRQAMVEWCRVCRFIAHVVMLLGGCCATFCHLVYFRRLETCLWKYQREVLILNCMGWWSVKENRYNFQVHDPFPQWSWFPQNRVKRS
jgi:hypothetical protein